jgi:hypothetical protein
VIHHKRAARGRTETCRTKLKEPTGSPPAGSLQFYTECLPTFHSKKGRLDGVVIAHMKAKDKGRLPPFVPLLVDTLDSPAWLALSHGARSLYIALRRRYSTNFKNNGKIYLATRDAAKELGSGLEEIGNWYRELQHYGFIVMTTGGCLGVEGVGKAPHWRLTEVGHMKELPTKDFLRWDGTKFRRRTPLRKQNPDTESRISSDTESRISKWNK